MTGGLGAPSVAIHLLRTISRAGFGTRLSLIRLAGYPCVLLVLRLISSKESVRVRVVAHALRS
jgi:hypothetical protein